MSEDDYVDPFDEPTMEICIETLTGTSFEMKVYPQDTVLHIKNKIQRVEGIPVQHQNLLFRMRELEDHKKLGDLGITNGSTLKLVLSMRGGPISTRRLSSCDHHVTWKDLKELIDHARDDFFEKGSKISLFVFKEGDMVNLLRIIENEDGSYSPYTDKDLDEEEVHSFDRVAEDNHMLGKILKLREKMQDVNVRRNSRNKPHGDEVENEAPVYSKCVGENRVSYKLLKECAKSEENLQIHEHNFEKFLNSQLEIGEIALKEKHRTKFNLPSLSSEDNTKPKSIYSETKGTYSLTKEKYANNSILKAKKDKTEDKWSEKCTATFNCVKNSDVEPTIAEPITVIGSPVNKSEIFGAQASESVSGLHFARLVLPDNTDSSPDGLKLEENAQEIWQIHDSSERVKNSATCKIGLLNRRNFTLDGDYDSTTQDVGDFAYKNSDFEVFGRNFYPLPQFQNSIGKKEERMCDFVLGTANNVRRSPLYGRKTHETDEKFDNSVTVLPQIKRTNFPSGVSHIERLCNDYIDCDETDKFKTNVLNPLRLKTSEESQVLANEIKRIGIQENDTKIHLRGVKLDELPPAVKKKQLRCDKCNRKLNITNNYRCRCGKMFCAQHRYSEVHNCEYDYKSEGRIILERQNPLVVAEKLRKI